MIICNCPNLKRDNICKENDLDIQRCEVKNDCLLKQIAIKCKRASENKINDDFENGKESFADEILTLIDIEETNENTL